MKRPDVGRSMSGAYGYVVANTYLNQCTVDPLLIHIEIFALMLQLIRFWNIYVYCLHVTVEYLKIGH